MTEPLTDETLEEYRYLCDHPPSNDSIDDVLEFADDASAGWPLCLDEIDRLKAELDKFRYVAWSCNGCSIRYEERHMRIVGGNRLCIACIVKLVPEKKSCPTSKS